MSRQPVDEIGPADCPTSNSLPMLGLGTWQNTDPETCATSVETALECGYRHIDTAQIYENEGAVGDGIAQSSVDRDEVTLATKVWISNLAADDVLETTRASLDRLGVESVELLYVHWPARTYDPEETFGAFAELVDEGLIEGVGVSNFEPDQLETAIEVSDVPIVANQVECHPLLPQTALRETCAETDVELVAYSPLARGEVFDQPELQTVAERHGVSEAQVSLAWLRHHDITAIPKATGRDHIEDNWGSLALELDDDEVALIDGITDRSRVVDPGFAPWNQ